MMLVCYMPVMQDFDIGKYGFQWIKPNSQTAAIFDDGQALVLSHMVEDTKDSITKFSFNDAVTYGRLMRKWKKIVAEILGPATYLPPMLPIEITMAMQKTPIGQEMLDIGEASPMEIITETFEHEKVRTAMLYASCMWGLDPRETGLGFLVPLMIDRSVNKRYCYGGSHKFAGALGREVIKNDYRPLQMGCFRPNQDCSDTSTPIEGLYTCGVSTYPGGLVLGGPGYLAANKAVEDLGVEKWWKPTPEMEKYTRTYLD